MIDGRKCGGCKACCTINGIEELDKPIRTHCPNECEVGCTVYPNHPPSCQTFKCVWIRGFGSDNERPDKLGLFVEERAGPPDGRQMVVKEIQRGAVTSSKGWDYISRLKRASGLNMYIMDWDLIELEYKLK
jgi:hypothetical protein